MLKTLLLDYCTKTSTDFHPGFPVTFLFLFLFLHYYSVALCQLCFYNKDWIGVAAPREGGAAGARSPAVKVCAPAVGWPLGGGTAAAS